MSTLTRINSAGAPAPDWTPGFSAWRDDLPGKPKPPAQWFLDPEALVDACADMLRDSTDPWIGVESAEWMRTFDAVSGPHPPSIQRAANGFDVEAWRAQQATQYSPAASAPQRMMRDHLAWRNFCQFVTGRRISIREQGMLPQYKAAQGWNLDGAAVNRVLDKPKPVNPECADDGYLWMEGDMAIMVLSVPKLHHFDADGEPVTFRRWVVVLTERIWVSVRNSAEQQALLREYGRTTFRPGQYQVNRIVERLTQDWHEFDDDEALRAAQTWRSEIGISAESLRPIAGGSEIPMDPEMLYYAQVRSEAEGASELRVILAVSD